MRPNHCDTVQGWKVHNNLHAILGIDVGILSHEEADVTTIGQSGVGEEAIESYRCQIGGKTCRGSDRHTTAERVTQAGIAARVP